jgi:hypothetical protein
VFLEYDPSTAVLLSTEAVCTTCHLTYHRALGACPDCSEEPAR